MCVYRSAHVTSAAPQRDRALSQRAPDKLHFTYVYPSISEPTSARCVASEGAHTARAQLEPTNSTLTAACCVQPEITENAKNCPTWLHATFRRERRVQAQLGRSDHLREPYNSLAGSYVDGYKCFILRSSHVTFAARVQTESPVNTRRAKLHFTHMSGFRLCSHVSGSCIALSQS